MDIWTIVHIGIVWPIPVISKLLVGHIGTAWKSIKRRHLPFRFLFFFASEWYSLLHCTVPMTNTNANILLCRRSENLFIYSIWLRYHCSASASCASYSSLRYHRYPLGDHEILACSKATKATVNLQNHTFAIELWLEDWKSLDLLRKRLAYSLKC